MGNPSGLPMSGLCIVLCILVLGGGVERALATDAGELWIFLPEGRAESSPVSCSEAEGLLGMECNPLSNDTQACFEDLCCFTEDTCEDNATCCSSAGADCIYDVCVCKPGFLNPPFCVDTESLLGSPWPYIIAGIMLILVITLGCFTTYTYYWGGNDPNYQPIHDLTQADSSRRGRSSSRKKISSRKHDSESGQGGSRRRSRRPD